MLFNILMMKILMFGLSICGQMGMALRESGVKKENFLGGQRL